MPELLRRGHAYPCFATKTELDEITARQRAAGAPPGYYWQWAAWRDAPVGQVTARLAAGDPYVVRFRSPARQRERVRFTDAIRGELEHDAKRKDLTDPGDQRFSGLDPTLVRQLAAGFAASYQPPAPDADWFAQIRDLAARHGFAPTQKAYKKDPGAYPGCIRDASQAIRVMLTGTTRSPDIAAVADVLGTSEVLRRATALAG